MAIVYIPHSLFCNTIHCFLAEASYHLSVIAGLLVVYLLSAVFISLQYRFLHCR